MAKATATCDDAAGTCQVYPESRAGARARYFLAMSTPLGQLDARPLVEFWTAPQVQNVIPSRIVNRGAAIDFDLRFFDLAVPDAATVVVSGKGACEAGLKLGLTTPVGQPLARKLTVPKECFPTSPVMGWEMTLAFANVAGAGAAKIQVAPLDLKPSPAPHPVPKPPVK